MITPEVWRALELAHFAAKGSWPIAGGVLDQCQVFLDACSFIWADEAQIKAEMMRAAEGT